MQVLIKIVIDSQKQKKKKLRIKENVRNFKKTDDFLCDDIWSENFINNHKKIKLKVH